MTYEDLYDQVITDWCNRKSITVDDAGYNMIVVSKVIAALGYLIVKMIDGIKNNVWVGSMQAAKLIEVGADKIGRTPYESTQGEYVCSTIEKTPGNIPEGTIFTKEIDGNLYKYESLAEVAAGDPITVRALTAGTDSELVVSDTLTSQQVLTYAESEITVTSVSETPTNDEDIEDYRAVVVAYERLRLGNGNASDYIVWVSNVNGLRTAYPYTADGEAGKAVIYCESSDDEVLVPSSGLIDDAIDAIKYDSEGKSQPPVEFFEFVNTTYVLAVQITDVRVNITNGDSGQQSDIEDLLNAYLLDKRPFLHTVNKEPELTDDLNTLTNTIAQVDIIQILANAGITFDAIQLQVQILQTGGFVTKTKYVVGYRGGDTFPDPIVPSSDPALPAYYGECPLLESVNFV